MTTFCSLLNSIVYILLKQRKYLWFSAFPNFRKMGEFAASIERSKAKSVSAPRPGALPLDSAGTSAIGSRSARSPYPPLCQILITPLQLINN